LEHGVASVDRLLDDRPNGLIGDSSSALVDKREAMTGWQNRRRPRQADRPLGYRRD
jgi:hypothetical protein